MEINKRIKEIIQDEIHNFAIEQLKNGKSKESTTKASDYDKIKEI